MLQTPGTLKMIDTSQFDYRRLNSHQNLKSVGLYYKNLKLVLDTGLIATLSKCRPVSLQYYRSTFCRDL